MRRVAWVLAGILLGTVTFVAQSDRRLARADAGDSGRRVAFVVGNNRYPESPLKNAVADATAMASVLEGELGFHVTRVTDAGLDVLETALDRFVSAVNPGDLALFYYAGHAYEIKGENYLLPVDFRADQEAQVKRRALSAAEVEERLAERGARVRLVILDACRNNPYGANRSGAGGMAPMSPQGALVLFATAPRQTAADNPDGSNGLFTQELLKALRVPGLQISDVVRRVRQSVYAASNGRQVPWYHDGLIGDLVLRPPMAAAVAPAPAAAPASTTAPSLPAASVSLSATTPAAADPSAVFSIDADVALMFTMIKADQTAAFETLLNRLQEGMNRTQNPARRAQAAGWRIYRTQDLIGGNAAYISYLDPVIRGAEYDLLRLLIEVELLPSQVNQLAVNYKNAFAGRQLIGMTRLAIAGMGGGAIGAGSIPPPVAPSQPVFPIDSSAALLIKLIKPEHAAAADRVLSAVSRSFLATQDPALQRQARGWRMYKTDALVSGSAGYVELIDPADPRLEYDLFRIIHKFFPAESTPLFESYREAYVGRQVFRLDHWMDLGR